MKIKSKLNSLLLPLFVIFSLFLSSLPAKALEETNSSAYLVVGQQNLTTGTANQGGSVNSNTLNKPSDVLIVGSKMIVSDVNNNRVLIFNTIPTSNNASADVVIGQTNMTSNTANQGGSVAANTLSAPGLLYSDGTKLFIGDTNNNRVLIFNTIPTSNNASADVVIGQTNMTSNSDNQGGLAAANTLSYPGEIYSDGTKLFIADGQNSRVLIFNTIPTSNNASADVVIGQTNKTGFFPNQGGSIAANTLFLPLGVTSDGTKLFVSDILNNRVLIYNTVPTSDNASANVVVGQTSMSGGSADQGGSAGANTLDFPGARYVGSRLFIADYNNNRVLMYNTIPTSNNASADVVIGQQNMTSTTANQGGSVAANTLRGPAGMKVLDNQYILADSDNNRVLFYKFKAIIAEIGAIGATADTTPTYTFSTDEAGTISYSGDCSSGTTSASAGNNTITFNNLSDGTYSDCKITVTNGAGIASSQLDISSFTIDTTDPVISNVTNGSINSSDVTPTFNEGTATLNGASFTSGTTVSTDGSYTLVVTDSANNSTTVTFTIDKTDPVVSNAIDGSTYASDVVPTFNEGTATLNGSSFTSGTSISAEGDYTLIVTDTAGNSTTVAFSIDKSVAAPSGVTNGETYRYYVSPTFTEGTATLNSYSFASGQNITEDGDYVLILTDSLGNRNTTQFKIERITTPTPVVKYSKYKNEKRKLKIKIYNLTLPHKAKSEYFSVKLNGKRARVIRAHNKEGYLSLTVKLKYGKWAKGTYDLALTYKKLVGNKWQKESLRKNGLVTIK